MPVPPPVAGPSPVTLFACRFDTLRKTISLSLERLELDADLIVPSFDELFEFRILLQSDVQEMHTEGSAS